MQTPEKKVKRNLFHVGAVWVSQPKTHKSNSFGGMVSVSFDSHTQKKE
jgi:hypothetical protein